jgi:hypothetical protein
MPNRLFPSCPVDGCTDAKPCRECLGSLVVVLATATGQEVTRDAFEAASGKMYRLAAERFRDAPPDPD